MKIFQGKRDLARTIRRATPQSIFTCGLIFALLLAILQAGYFLFVKDNSGFIAINDILNVVSDLAAASAMAYGAWWSRRLDRHLGSAWYLFMLAMACWAVGDILWAYYELIVGEVPSPFIGDMFYLTIYPLFLIGILRIPRQDGNSTRVAWLWLDFFIVLFSAFGIYWNFLIGPAILNHERSWLAILVNTAYPVGDLILIMAITLIIFLPRSPLWLKPMLFMLIGHGLTAVADSIFNYQTINGSYDSGALFNILFSIGPLVLMLSGLSQAVTAKQVIDEQKTTPIQLWSGSITVLRLVVPFLWLLFAYGMLNFNTGSKHAFRPVQFSTWVSVIIILLALRQVLATLDNDRLSGELHIMNGNLERRVAERSADLIVSNAELRREMEERKRIEMMLREREEKLARFALYDALTGLPNRSLLFDRLTQAIQHYRRAKDRYAVLFLDLDSFKVVNDSLGHPVGDQLLIQIGQRLTSLVRAEDTVARLGGDEFVILLERFNDENFVSVITGRILNSINEPFVLDTRSIYVTASIGVVIANPDYHTAVEIIRDADLAMYEAKSSGKARCVIFTPELHTGAIDRLALDSDLHQALVLNQFVLHYQPIISLGSESLVGFEALIRWKHPTRGLIDPSEFIPIAESNGFIDAITRWSLQEACRQLQEWHVRFPHNSSLSVSVNLSPYSLRRPELSQWVDESLHASSLPPSCLTIDIVETALIPDADLAKRAFTDLRLLGVKVSLDDFGIGYSSLGYINEYPIDFLKIDHSFVSRVTKAQKVASVVRAIITLARELGVEVIAEGIESRRQLDFMKEAGCKYGQGFLFSRPLAPQGIQALYLQHLSF